MVFWVPRKTTTLELIKHPNARERQQIKWEEIKVTSRINGPSPCTAAGLQVGCSALPSAEVQLRSVCWEHRCQMPRMHDRCMAACSCQLSTRSATCEPGATQHVCTILGTFQPIAPCTLQPARLPILQVSILRTHKHHWAGTTTLQTKMSFLCASSFNFLGSKTQSHLVS